MTLDILYRQIGLVIEKHKYGVDLVEWELTTCQWQRLLYASAPVPYVIMRAFRISGIGRHLVATGSPSFRQLKRSQHHINICQQGEGGRAMGRQ